MYKKYKVKKRNKKTNVYLIFFTLVIVCITVSYAYSNSAAILSIIGRASTIGLGKSTYVWNFVSNNTEGWGSGTSSDPRTYQPIITITNNDGELSGWTVSFEVQEGVVPDSVTTWTNTASVSGNTVTIGSLQNETIRDGDQIVLNFQIQFTNKTPLKIVNLRLNGKLVKCLGTANVEEKEENIITNTLTNEIGGETVNEVTGNAVIGEPMNWGTTATYVTVTITNNTNYTKTLTSFYLNFSGNSTIIDSLEGMDGKMPEITKVKDNQYLVTVTNGAWANEMKKNASQEYTIIVRSQGELSNNTTATVSNIESE